MYFFHPENNQNSHTLTRVRIWVWWNTIYSYIYQTVPTTSAPSLFYSILSDLRWNNIDSFQFPSCFIVMTSETRTSEKLTYDLNIRKNGFG